MISLHFIMPYYSKPVIPGAGLFFSIFFLDY